MSGFEIIVQVRQSAIEAILQAQHRRGILRHERATSVGNRKTELILGRPRITLIPSSGAMSTIDADLELNAVFSAFNQDTGTPILAEVLKLKVHTKTEFATSQNPTPYTPDLHLLLGWTAQASDILTTAGTAPAPETISSVLSTMREWHDTFPLPGLARALPSLTRVGYRVVAPFGGGDPFLSVGLNLGEAYLADYGPALDQLTASIVRHDWAIRFSEAYVLSRIGGALSTFLGGLPPPNGASSIPFPGVDGVSLDRLAFAFEGNHIAFTGSVSGPGGSATFRFNLNLMLHTSSIDVEVSDVGVDVHLDFLASVLNFFSGGSISDSIKRAISDALHSDISGQFSGFFSEDLLSKFAAGGLLGALKISPAVSSLTIANGGVLMEGTLSVTDRSAAPVVTFKTKQIGDAPVAQVPDFSRPSTSSFASAAVPQLYRTTAPSGGRPGSGSIWRETPQIATSSLSGTTAVTGIRAGSGSLAASVGAVPGAFQLSGKSGPAVAIGPASPSPALGLGPTIAGTERAGRESAWVVLFDGSTSWAPGGDCVQYVWDFGDRARETTSGPNMRAVTMHAYQAGSYRASLTVMDSSGRFTTEYHDIAIGGLVLDLMTGDSPGPWDLCRASGTIQVRFRVRHGESPIAGAVVTVAGSSGPTLQTTSDAGGFATVTIDLSSTVPLSQPSRSGLHLVGVLKVSASRTGYRVTEVDLPVYDCDQTSFDPSRVDDLHQELNGILAGWAVNDPRGAAGGGGPVPTETPGVGTVGQGSIARATEIVAELGFLARGGGSSPSKITAIGVSSIVATRSDAAAQAQVMQQAQIRAQRVLTALGLQFMAGGLGR